jgi:hypothetical protein
MGSSKAVEKRLLAREGALEKSPLQIAAFPAVPAFLFSDKCFPPY